MFDVDLIAEASWLQRVIKSLINNRLSLLTVGWHERFVFFSSFYTSFNAVDLVKLIGVPLIILTNLRSFLFNDRMTCRVLGLLLLGGKCRLICLTFA